MESEGQSFVPSSLREKEFAERRSLEILIAIRLHQLKHDRVDLVCRLLLKALYGKLSDLIEPRLIIGEAASILGFEDLIGGEEV
jgi:hypothetical protein